MARLKHYFEYSITLTLAKVAQTLSPTTSDKFAAALGTIAYKLLSSRRRISNDNIRSTIGAEMSDIEINSITKKVFQNLGRSLFEIARFGKLEHKDILKIISGDSELINKIHSEKKGGIILTCHYGNWELLGSWPAALGFATDFLVGTQHNSLVNEQLISYRRNLGVGIIPAESALRGIFKSLKSNHFVGIAGDQHSPNGIRINFLGKDALHARGPALFSIRTGAPIIPMMLRRERFDKHIAYAAPPIYPNPVNNEEDEVKRITQTAVKYFEDFIRKYPDQWAWTHRRWKI